MTRAEAIRIIEIAKAEAEWEKSLEYQIAFEMAIEALKGNGRFSDIEKRIFLSAMKREHRICQKTDEESPGGINLASVVMDIERKIKKSDMWKE